MTLEKIMSEVQEEYGMGGLSDGIYGSFAREVAERYSASLKAENDALQSQVATLQADPGSWQSGYDTGRKSMAGHADSWRKEAAHFKAKSEELRKDADRLDRLDMEGEAYGTEVHEGNRWVVDGPFATVRDAIDAAMAKEKGHV